MVNQSDQYVGFPTDLGGGFKTSEKPRAMPFTFDFSGGTLAVPTVSYSVNLENQMSRHLIEQIQSVYCDNSAGAVDVTVTFQRNTWQNIIIPAGFQGYFPLVVSGDCRFIISSGWGGSATFQFILLNVPVASNWPVKAPQYNVSSAGVNSGAKPKLYPNWKANQAYTGSVVAAGNTTMVSISPNEGFFLTSILVGITGSAQLAAPGDLTVLITSGLGGFPIYRTIYSVPAAPVAGNFTLINQVDLGFNSRQSDGDLVINLSAALTAGSIYWSVGAGPTNIFG